MSLLRAAGRTMLASFFVVQGAKTALKPDAFVSSAEPVADRIVPLAKRLAPPTVSMYIPRDTKTLVRYTGVAQVLSGLGLATGIGRRPASSVLAASMVPHVLASRPAKGASADEKTAARSQLLRNIALTGAALIAAGDTEGKPSLAYLAGRQQKKIAKAASRQQSSFSKAVSEKQDELAKATRKQRKQLAKQGKQWKKDAAKQQKQLSKNASKQGKRLSHRTSNAGDQAGSKLNDLVSQLEAALS